MNAFDIFNADFISLRCGNFLRSYLTRLVKRWDMFFLAAQTRLDVT